MLRSVTCCSDGAHIPLAPPLEDRDAPLPGASHVSSASIVSRMAFFSSAAVGTAAAATFATFAAFAATAFAAAALPVEPLPAALFRLLSEEDEGSEGDGPEVVGRVPPAPPGSAPIVRRCGAAAAAAQALGGEAAGSGGMGTAGCLHRCRLASLCSSLVCHAVPG